MLYRPSGDLSHVCLAMSCRPFGVILALAMFGYAMLGPLVTLAVFGYVM